MKLSMKWRILGVLIVIVLFVAINAYAKTASQVFEEVSSSIVIVLNFDANGDLKGFGSGVVLSDGVLATNYHVIKEAEKIQVVHQGKKYLATLRHLDWDRDVCTLSVSGFKAPTVVLGSTSQLRVGARVYAVGAPQGLELTLTEGIVSALRQLEGGTYIQHTAAISPGSSGGGMFDEQGRLLGLTTFYIAESQSLNFAVPVEWIEELPKRHTSGVKNTETILDRYNKSLLLVEKKNWSELLDLALRWTEDKPQEACAWFILGVAYEESEQTVKAIEAYQHALRIYSEDASLWIGLGRAYYKSDLIAKAIEAFQQALRIDPENAVAWYNLGNAYEESEQTVKAIEAYQHALRIYSEDASLWIGLGRAYYKSDLIAKAIEAFQQALRIDPENAVAWYNLGVAYGFTGQTAKVIEAFQQALRIDPENADIWYYLGCVYSICGNREQAMDVYQKLKILDQSMADDFFEKIILP